MYNGVEAQQVKGTGLSGYVQRSKASARSQLSRFRPAAVASDSADAIPAETINPLLAKRSQRENNELAARLEAHKAVRAAKLKVLLYREERLAQRVDDATVDRECLELYKSLMAVAMEEQRERQKAEHAKSAERFAAAFGVATGDKKTANAFDRAKLEEEKRVSEEERRVQTEHQLAERLKRIRQEAPTRGNAET